jgi:hypothetical protein
VSSKALVFDQAGGSSRPTGCKNQQFVPKHTLIAAIKTDALACHDAIPPIAQRDGRPGRQHADQSSASEAW